MAGLTHTSVATGFDEALVQRLLARALARSLHEVYLGRRERRELSRRVPPLLAQRGPPGTHDVALVGWTLDALRGMRSGETIRVRTGG